MQEGSSKRPLSDTSTYNILKRHKLDTSFKDKNSISFLLNSIDNLDQPLNTPDLSFELNNTNDCPVTHEPLYSSHKQIWDIQDSTNITSNKEAVSPLSPPIIYSLFSAKETYAYTCKLCSFAFSTSEDLKKHYSFLHEDEVPSIDLGNRKEKDISNAGNLLFEFDLRDDRDSLNEKLTNGIVGQTDNEQVIDNNGSLNKSMHTGEKPYKCDYPSCTKSFMQKASLKDHKNGHTDTKSYVCKECGDSFSHRKQLQRHQQKLHPQDSKLSTNTPNTYPLKKNPCSTYTFKEMSTVFDGQVYKSQSLLPYPCNYPGCKTGFLNKTSLEAHTRLHTKEKPYICKECHKAFTYRYQLSQHQQTSKHSQSTNF